jgi:hypothetical protein
VTFSGGGLAKPVTKSDSIGAANVEVDLNSRVDEPAAPPPAAAAVLESGQDTLALWVSEDAWQGNAQFTVSVDGQQIGGVQTAMASLAAGQTQAFDVKGTFGAGQHTVTVDFLNDAWGGTAATDRNLYVTAATFDGSTVLAGTLAEYTAGPESFTFQAGATTGAGLAQADAASGTAGDAMPPATDTGAVPAGGTLGGLLADSATPPAAMWDHHNAATGQAPSTNERSWHGGFGGLPDHPIPGVGALCSTHPFG